ncbi:MAG: type II toxin-antitoxin system VapC family toxin [Anaerolineae bacterium]|nr:type II toxin-antitoxin system VapC family toxin [Anaerolineae bacterium]
MPNRFNVFLDTSVLFSAVYSAGGGARMILKLGEARAINLWVGPWVLREAEAVIERKAATSKALFAVLLDRSMVQVTREATPKEVTVARQTVPYPADAQILAEAIVSGADYFVSFDREHFLGNPDVHALSFRVGTAGDSLEWYRQQLTRNDD